LTATAVGSYGGTVSFGTSDPANNPYAFTVTGTVTALPTLPPVQIVDDGDPTGFMTVGSWTAWAGMGYHGNIHQGVAGTGSDIATWTFPVAPGTYQVAATWAAHPNRATNAPFTILDGGAALGTVHVNQQVWPADFSDLGASWKALGTFTVTTTTL